MIKLSFVICTYNNKKLVKRCLDSIFSQNYKHFEVICVDGGSKDGTLELLKNYNIRIIYNKKRFPEGKRMGKDQGYKKAKGKIICFIDQDNKLIGKNWIKNSLEPFKNKDVFGVAIKLYLDKKDSMINRYLSLVGTDPFAIYRSLEGRLGLKNIKLRNQKEYYIYTIKKEDMLCTGGNCFLIRKKLLDLINGYTQDVEMIYSLVIKGYNKLAIPKKIYVHHLTANSLMNFIKKRFMWGLYYINKNKENRNYSWLPINFKDYIIFGVYNILNLTIIYNLFVGIKNIIRDKEFSWILHPLAMFYTNLIYIYLFFYSKLKTIIFKLINN